MPFRSSAQRSWMYANKPLMAKEWEKETPKGNLPKRIGPTKLQKASDMLKRAMKGKSR